MPYKMAKKSEVFSQMETNLGLTPEEMVSMLNRM